jgi:SAM-dependent methyltransferase
MIETEVSSRPTCSALWDQLWRCQPSDAKDDALLARERRSPRWRTIVERLEATFGSTEGLNTIELGSGRGDLSTLLAQSGARPTLLDTSENGLAQAERRFDRLGLTGCYEQADMLGTLEAYGQRFDVALSSGVIEHFKGDDRTRAVRAHFDVLRPGGMAVISVPHAWCMPYRIWKFYLELRGWWPYGTEIPYARRALARCARTAGFSRVETCCMGFWQSVGDHWGGGLLGRGPDWVDKPSRLDSVMGLILLMFAWRCDAAGDSACEGS